MQEHFAELGNLDDPGRDDLRRFLGLTLGFLSAVVEDEETFGFVWDNYPGLRDEASETFQYDVEEAAVVLEQKIDTISEEALHDHGLVGRAARFKFRVLDAVTRQFTEIGSRFSIQSWFDKVIEAIDALLDSLIDAAGGAGGLIKEFKDALSALASD